MTDYLIYRRGANAANQSGRDNAPVLIVNGADSADSAIAIAKNHVDTYANQRLSAVARDNAPDEDWNELLERDAMASAYGEPSLSPIVSA